MTYYGLLWRRRTVNLDERDIEMDRWWWWVGYYFRTTGNELGPL